MENKTYISHISDNHNNYNIAIGEGNILIHSGDATNAGTEKEVEKLALFFSKALQSYDNVIFVPGNHDVIFETDEKKARSLFLQSRIHVLINESLNLGGLKFYGSPNTKSYGSYAFQMKEVELNQFHHDSICRDANVLITHGPPFGILDYAPRVGNLGTNMLTYLSESLECKELKLHCFGHIHESYGVREKNGIIYSNGAMGSYFKTPRPFSPVRFELIGTEVVNYIKIEESL